MICTAFIALDTGQHGQVFRRTSFAFTFVISLWLATNIKHTILKPTVKIWMQSETTKLRRGRWYSKIFTTAPMLLLKIPLNSWIRIVTRISIKTNGLLRDVPPVKKFIRIRRRFLELSAKFDDFFRIPQWQNSSKIPLSASWSRIPDHRQNPTTCC